MNKLAKKAYEIQVASKFLSDISEEVTWLFGYERNEDGSIMKDENGDWICNKDITKLSDDEREKFEILESLKRDFENWIINKK